MTTKQIKKAIPVKVSVTRPSKGTLKGYTLIQSSKVNLTEYKKEILNILPNATFTSSSMVIA